MPQLVKLNLGYDIVHVKVGKEAKDFGIHKHLICHHSPHFNAAFTSGFEEAKTGVMILDDADPAIFEMFYQRLYTQNLWDENADQSEWPAPADLLMLYLFADLSRVVHLKNQILDTLCKMDVDSRGPVAPLHIFPFL